MADERRAVLDAYEALRRLYPPGAGSSSEDARDLSGDLFGLDSYLAGNLHSLGTLGDFAPHMRAGDPAKLLAWDFSLEERARALAESTDPLEAQDGRAFLGYLEETKRLTNVARRFVGLSNV